MKPRDMRSQSIVFKSTYGLKKDSSFRGESFRSIPLTWRLGVCNIEILKVRVASWRPKLSRSNSAVFYYEVDTLEKADNILLGYKDFSFKKVENLFEDMYIKDNVLKKNTGAIMEWLMGVFIPKARELFPIQNGNI